MKLSKTIYQPCLIIILIIITSGIAFAQELSRREGSVKIGLLVQDSSWRSAVQGAELAVSISNNNGGLNGRIFQLVVRSMEGPWGTGSKQAVDLIFKEKVWALTGLHDGRNAHLVEQAATKSQVVFLTAWTGDPTLSQAFVPWYFNCVPNDNQQAASIFKEIYEIRKYGNIVVVHGNDYDSGKSFGSFMSIIKMKGKPDPIQLNIGDYAQKPEILADKIIGSHADCLVIFCDPTLSSGLILQIIKKNPRLPVFGPLAILNENELSVQDMNQFETILSVPAGEWPEEENQKFRLEFLKRYGYVPGMVASYSFDCMSLLIEAIKKAGTDDRELIQKSLQTINYPGVTGSVRFDEKGNRMGNSETVKLKNGVPVSWEK